MTCLELVSEAVRAVLEEAARDAPEVLDELVTAEWARRYGRPVRLCSRPSHPLARLEQVGNDARELLQRLDARFPGGAPAQAKVLRAILVQHFLVDAKGVTGVTEVVRSTVRVGLDKFQIQGVTPEGLDKTMDPGTVSGSLKDLGDGGMAVSEVAAGIVGGVGSKVKVTMGDGTRVSFTVVAVYDRGLGFGDLTMAHDLVATHVDNPLSSAVLVKTDRTKEELASAVSGYPGVQVLGGDQVESLQADQQQSNAAVNFVAMGLIIAFTTIAVVNTLAMSTTGRTREFALLRLVGTTRLQVVRMLRLESLAVVLLAVVVGTAIAVATLTAFAIGMTGSAAPYLSAIVYAGIVAVAACLALAATMISARISLAGKPADVTGARE